MAVTNSIFRRSVGRFTIDICDYATTDPSFLYGGELEIHHPGHSPSDLAECHKVSLEDIRELHYLTGRVVAQAEEQARKALGKRS